MEALSIECLNQAKPHHGSPLEVIQERGREKEKKKKQRNRDQQNMSLYLGHNVVKESKVRVAEFAAVEFPLQCDHE